MIDIRYCWDVMYRQLTHMSCLLPHCKPSTMEPTTDEPSTMEPTLSPSFGPTLRDDPETSPEPSKAPSSPSEKSPTVAPSEGPTTTSAPSPPRNDNPGQSRPTPKPTYIIVIPPSPPSTAPPPKVSPGENILPCMIIFLPANFRFTQEPVLLHHSDHQDKNPCPEQPSIFLTFQELKLLFSD